MAVQEDHDVPHDPLLGPSRLDFLPPTRSDSLHIFQARRGIFDDLENFLPEFRHHLFRVNRADPADQSAAEIFFNALEGGRGVATDVRRAQLHPMITVPLPPPLRRDPFAGRDRRHDTDHRHQVAPAFYFHLEHRKAGVLIVEGDPLDQAGKPVHRCANFGSHRPHSACGRPVGASGRLFLANWLPRALL